MQWWKVKHRIKREAPKVGRFLLLVVGAGFFSFVFQCWGPKVWHHAKRWAQHSEHVSPRTPAPDTTNSYGKAFEHCFSKLRADRSVRLIAYEFPAEALRFQKSSPAGMWRLQGRSGRLPGIAVPRHWQAWLDRDGIVYIDPQNTPATALENKSTPLKVDVLKKYFVLVPDVTAGRRDAFGVVPMRLLGSNHR